MIECEGLYSRAKTPTLKTQVLPKYLFNFSKKEHSGLLFCCCCCFCLEENIGLLGFLKEEVDYVSLHKRVFKYNLRFSAFCKLSLPLSQLLSLSLKSGDILEYSRRASSFLAATSSANIIAGHPPFSSTDLRFAFRSGNSPFVISSYVRWALSFP